VLVVEAQVTTKIKEFTHVRDDGHLGMQKKKSPKVAAETHASLQHKA
jgi:hypothetical protein